MHPSGRFAYLAPVIGSNIERYSLDLETGEPTFAGTTVLGAVGAMDSHPNGGFLYAISFSIQVLATFEVHPATGDLNALPLVVLSGAALPTALAVSASGDHLFIGRLGKLEVYGIDDDPTNGIQDGSASLIDSFPLAGSPVDIAVDASGERLFVQLNNAQVEVVGVDGSVLSPGVDLDGLNAGELALRRRTE